MTEKEIQKYIDEFESKAQAAYDNYQMTGSNSTLKTKDRYEDLEDICRLALKQIEKSDSVRVQQYLSIETACKGIEDRLYSEEEVKRLLWKTY
jgi:hypothetical protein